MRDADFDHVDSQSIVALFLAAVKAAPTRSLFRQVSGATMPYGEACIRVVVTVKRLAELGLRRGDYMICYTDETLPLALFCLAAAVSGIVPVPLGPVFSTRYLSALVNRVGGHPVFTTPALAPKVNEAGLRCLCLDAEETLSLDDAIDRVSAAAKKIRCDDVFVVQPTSGSTGEPKLVLRMHRSFTRYAKYVGHEIRSKDTPPVFLAVLALTHAFGLHMFTTALSLGSELCIPDAIDTSASLEEVRSLNPSVLPMTPRVLWSFRRQHRVLTDGCPGSAMFGPAASVVVLAGGKCDPELLRFVEAEGIDAIEFYGSSEGSLVALTPRGKRREGYAGKVVADCNVRVDTDGELLVRSSGLMIGYFRDEVATLGAFTEDGYLRTGDLASVSDDGYVRILGRKRDVFNTPEGSNIYPERIETAIEGLPGVRQAMLVGDQRPYLAALVVLDSDIDDPGPDAFSEIECESLYVDFGARLAQINTVLEPMERVVCFRLLRRPFDKVSYALVGPGKVRRDRRALFSNYASEIALLYSASITQGSPMLVPPHKQRFNPEARLVAFGALADSQERAVETFVAHLAEAQKQGEST
jgi:long-subunit acyl-CoA synthetase (AMP-forming)